MTVSLLNDTVHRLTRNHRTMIERDSGKREAAMVLPLIEQLRMEKAAGSRSTGSGSKEHRAPVALQAVMIYADIAGTCNTWYRKITGHPGVDIPIEDKLRRWAANTQADNTGYETEVCLEYASRWVRQIEALLNPVFRVEIPGPCPVCEVTHVWAETDGDLVRNTAIIATTRDEAMCQHCGSNWIGPQLHILADIMKGTVAA